MNYEFQITNRPLQMIAGSRNTVFSSIEEEGGSPLGICNLQFVIGNSSYSFHGQSGTTTSTGRAPTGTVVMSAVRDVELGPEGAASVTSVRRMATSDEAASATTRY